MHGADTALRFVASPLPVIGRAAGARRAVGIALAYATEDAEITGADRFSLILVDAEGDVLQRLGSFEEDDVVAVWRDIAARAGLTRMIVREDGLLVPVSQQIGRLILGQVRIRRRHAGLGRRRPRFLARRKTGRLPARPQIFRGENEIIART
ncbi:hypothetical protein MCBMB27_04681 [Methylobacterium phyllosphaerae]|uniref:Uncharacterized protein n=1 Tax=Methylobacterium phyllosphaerae TaxID=418223 RepID=A0AAE8HT00_9HYPH|nr:DUF6101 family protein [Methylobacterium phyllosphaerae]APT33972.1 hypothetical protein MCBMB27_04681 [Methylobacterium phyllosphaerae]SFH07272.1 hypothetical protein SAMN05192567_11388 [Methylobacterium phyllosphaerae]